MPPLPRGSRVGRKAALDPTVEMPRTAPRKERPGAPPPEPQDDEQPEEQPEEEDTRTRREKARDSYQEYKSQPNWGGVPGVKDAGGFVLAILVWGWIGLPLLNGGPSKVIDVLRAKFINKGPDGEWLP